MGYRYVTVKLAVTPYTSQLELNKIMVTLRIYSVFHAGGNIVICTFYIIFDSYQIVTYPCLSQRVPVMVLSVSNISMIFSKAKQENIFDKQFGGGTMAPTDCVSAFHCSILQGKLCIAGENVNLYTFDWNNRTLLPSFCCKMIFLCAVIKTESQT